MHFTFFQLSEKNMNINQQENVRNRILDYTLGNDKSEYETSTPSHHSLLRRALEDWYQTPGDQGYSLYYNASHPRRLNISSDAVHADSSPKISGNTLSSGSAIDSRNPTHNSTAKGTPLNMTNSTTRQSGSDLLGDDSLWDDFSTFDSTQDQLDNEARSLECGKFVPVATSI